MKLQISFSAGNPYNPIKIGQRSSGSRPLDLPLVFITILALQFEVVWELISTWLWITIVGLLDPTQKVSSGWIDGWGTNLLIKCWLFLITYNKVNDYLVHKTWLFPHQILLQFTDLPKLVEHVILLDNVQPDGLAWFHLPEGQLNLKQMYNFKRLKCDVWLGQVDLVHKYSSH